MRGSVRRLEPSKSYMRYSGKARSVVSRCIVSLNRRQLVIPLILIAALLVSMSAIHPVRAQPVSQIYLAPNDIPAQAPGTTIAYNLTADMVGTTASSGINGWDIQITDNDPTMANLNPLSISIAGNLLASFGQVSEQINCVNGGVGFAINTPGNINCNTPGGDGAGVVHTAAVLLGSATPTPISGLIARIVYSTVGS